MTIKKTYICSLNGKVLFLQNTCVLKAFLMWHPQQVLIRKTTHNK